MRPNAPEWTQDAPKGAQELNFKRSKSDQGVAAGVPLTPRLAPEAAAGPVLAEEGLWFHPVCKNKKHILFEP